MNDVYTLHVLKNKLKPVFEAAPVYRAILFGSYLFGSYARGEANGNSDVDIVIDSHGEWQGIHFYGVLEDAVTALDKNVDLIEMSEIRPGSLIFDIIKQQGVVLYDRQG